MPEKRRNAEEIIHKLREVDVLLGQDRMVARVGKQLNITQQTYSRWRKIHGAMRVDQSKRRCLWLNDGSCIRLKPTRTNQV